MSLNYQASQASGSLLRAIAHPLRMYILAFIDKNKSTNVKNIYKTLDLEQSIVSQHLRILRTQGVVEAKREGKQIFYSLNYNKIDLVNKGVIAFAAHATQEELTENDFGSEK